MSVARRSYRAKFHRVPADSPEVVKAILAQEVHDPGPPTHLGWIVKMDHYPNTYYRLGGRCSRFCRTNYPKASGTGQHYSALLRRKKTDNV